MKFIHLNLEVARDKERANLVSAEVTDPQNKLLCHVATAGRGLFYMRTRKLQLANAVVHLPSSLSLFTFPSTSPPKISLAILWLCLREQAAQPTRSGFGSQNSWY